jgi:hypothetical protein
LSRRTYYAVLDCLFRQWTWLVFTHRLVGFFNALII